MVAWARSPSWDWNFCNTCLFFGPSYCTLKIICRAEHFAGGGKCIFHIIIAKYESFLTWDGDLYFHLWHKVDPRRGAMVQWKSTCCPAEDPSFESWHLQNGNRKIPAWKGTADQSQQISARWSISCVFLGTRKHSLRKTGWLRSLLAASGDAWTSLALPNSVALQNSHSGNPLATWNTFSGPRQQPKKKTPTTLP